MVDADQTEGGGDLRFVFVVAYARSGSTLLQSLINSCPGVQIRGENENALYHLYRAITAVEETQRERGTANSLSPDTPWSGADLMKPKAFENRLLQSFVRRVLVPDAKTKVTGFKEIRYNQTFVPHDHFAPYMEFLLTRFAGARIVFNSRRAADVAKSGFLAQQNPERVKAWVADTDARFAGFAKGSDRVIRMRYEDYVQDHGLIHDMLTFLGLDWSPERVEQVLAKPLTHAKGKALVGKGGRKGKMS